MNLVLRPFGRCIALAWALGSALLLAPPGRAAEFALGPGDRVVGDLADYVVRPGDNLADIARHVDIGDTEMLAANPGVDPWSPAAGRKLTIPALYILPDGPRRGIVINLAERRLYYFSPDGRSVQTYPIGIGAIGFTTPLSTTRVVRKEPHPTWVPPPSIHAENPDLPAVVGPGPDNPLGDYALRLGWNNYLIHGTNKPDGVGRNVSHGCIHLYPEDIERLFNSVPAGTPVRAIEQSAGAAWIGIGLYVEEHPTKEQADAIDTDQPVAPEADPAVRNVVGAAAGDYAQAVTWNAVDQAAAQRSGLPVLVAQRPPSDIVSQAPAAETAAAPEESLAQGPETASDTAEVVPLDDAPAPAPRHHLHHTKPKPHDRVLR